MAQAIPLVTGVLGGIAGSFIGMPGLGFMLGEAMGSLIEQAVVGPEVPPNALTDLSVQTAAWGTGLPQVFGTQRLPGNIIWSTDKLLVGGDQGKFGAKGGGGGKGGAGKGKKGTGDQGYYTCAIAFALCEGPIGGIKRIWAGGDLIFDDGQPVYVPSMDPSQPQGGYQTFNANNQPIFSTGSSSLGSWTLYHGTMDQDADPTIVSNGSANGENGVPYQLVTLANGFTYKYGTPQYGKLGTACAYRGVAYIVFDALNCGYGGSIPPLTFEVVGQVGVLDAPTVQTPVYNPIPASLVNGTNQCFQAALIDDQTLCIPTTYAVCYCSTSGQLKDYSISQNWVVPPYASGFTPYVNTVVLSGSQQILISNYINGVRPFRSNAAWTPISIGSGTINNGPGNNYAINGGVWHLDSYYNNLWNPLIFNPSTHGVIPFSSANFYCGSINCAIGEIIFTTATNGGTQTLGTFNTATFAFATIVLPLTSGATIYKLFTDGTYLYVVDSNTYLYKFEVTATTATLINGYQLGATVGTTGTYFWGNGWLYGFIANTLYKYNANGGVRYTVSLPLLPMMAFPMSSGIIFLNDQDGATTGAQYYSISYGDLILTPTTPTLAQVVTAICNRAGFTSVDVSLIPSSVLVNATRKAGQSARDFLKMLCQVYQMDMVDSAGTLRIVPKGQNIVGQLSYDDIGYSKPGKSGAQPNSRYAFTRGQGTDLPRSVTLKYTTALANYNPTSQMFQTHDPYGQDISVNLPMTLDDTTAGNAAMLMCVMPRIENTLYAWTCNFTKLMYEAGDVLQMPWGVTRITQVDIRQGVDEPLIDFQGVIDASYVIYTGNGTPQSVPVPQIGQVTTYQSPLSITSSGMLMAEAVQPAAVVARVSNKPVINPGTAYGVIYEKPPLSSTDTTPNYLVAPWVTGNGFLGTAIFESTDGGTTFNEIAEQATSGVVGWTPNAIAATQPFTWDTVTTLSVYLNSAYMSLNSATDIQVIQGANLAYLGSELIQFVNAVLMTDANGYPYYQLSRLLRGRRGTESQMGNHSPGETFVLVQANDNTPIDYGLHDINNNAQFKIATVGANLSAIIATTFAPTGLWYKPFAPAHFKTSLDSSSDWNFTFVPRARINGWWGSGVAPTLDSDTQTWSADVLSGTTVKRTLSGSLSSPSFQYSATQQTADGFIAGQHGIVINLYQVGQLGRGYVTSVTT